LYFLFIAPFAMPAVLARSLHDRHQSKMSACKKRRKEEKEKDLRKLKNRE
jgi:hypothetical protein